MTDADLNSGWSKLTGKPQSQWAENISKLDLSFLTEAEIMEVTKQVTSIVSSTFYSLPSEKQDPYLFYSYLLQVTNKDVMSIVLKIKS